MATPSTAGTITAGKLAEAACGCVAPSARPTAPPEKHDGDPEPFDETEAEAPGREAVYCVALEPWYYVGGTLGAALSSQSGAGMVAGAWEGVPLEGLAVLRVPSPGPENDVFVRAGVEELPEALAISDMNVVLEDYRA